MKNIAVLAPNILNGYSAQMLSAMQAESFATDYDIVTYYTKAAGERGGLPYLLRKILEEKKASAVIIIAVSPEKDMIEEYKRAEVPIVVVENEVEGAHYVGVDNREGGYSAGKYLAEEGKEKVGVVLGNVEQASSQRQRYEGFLKAFSEEGRKFDERYIWAIGDYNIKAGKEAFRFMLMNEADAVFCVAGDYVAQGIIGEARRQGVNIPGAFSLVGFDDIEASEEFELTTIKQPLEDIGKTAFDFAVKAAQDPSIPLQSEIYKTKLVIRKTA